MLMQASGDWNTPPHHLYVGHRYQGDDMKDFLHATLMPGDLEVVSAALDRWSLQHGVAKSTPEFEMAASAVLNLFREGNRDLPSLQAAIARHKWLSVDMAGDPTGRSAP